MKKLNPKFSVLLSVLLLFGMLTACGGEAPAVTPAQPTVPAATEEAAPVVTDPPAPTEAVPTATEILQPEEINWIIPDHLKVGYDETFTWICQEGIEWNVHISLPTITCGEPFANELNAQIHEYYERISSYFRDHMERKDDPHIVSVSFDAHRNDHLLSIVIMEQTVDGHLTYIAYNYDLIKHRSISVSEVCDSYLDLDYTQFLSATDQLVKEDFDAIFAHLLDKEPEFYAFVHELVFSDITAVSERNLYLAENGTIMLIYHAPTEAGSLEDHTVLPFSHHKYNIPSESDAYHWLLDIAVTLDDAHRDGYIKILREAFEDDAEDFAEALAKLSQDHIDTIVNLVAAAYQTEPDRLRHLTLDEIEIPLIRDALLASIAN